jgi:hypothetical protein
VWLRLHSDNPAEAVRCMGPGRRSA